MMHTERKDEFLDWPSRPISNRLTGCDCFLREVTQSIDTAGQSDANCLALAVRFQIRYPPTKFSSFHPPHHHSFLTPLRYYLSSNRSHLALSTQRPSCLCAHHKKSNQYQYRSSEPSILQSGVSTIPEFSIRFDVQLPTSQPSRQ